MVSFVLHWSVTLLFLFAVVESVAADDAPTATATVADGAKEEDQNLDVRAPPDTKEAPTGSKVEQIIEADEQAEEEAANPSPADPKSPPESATRKDQDPGAEALKACSHLIPKEIQHVNLYAGSPAEQTAEGGQHETVTNSQQAGAKAVWGDLVRCVTHVAAAGLDLQSKLKAERNLNVGYAEQYTKVLESLRHLQGPDMYTAFEKDTQRTKADYNKQLDGIDKQLEVFKGYTRYGSSADRAHQEGDKRALLREVHSQSDQTSEEDPAAGLHEARIQASGTKELVKQGFSQEVAPI